MKNKEIVISISGLPGSGKSTLSQIIVNALGRAGIEAVSIESDGVLDRDSYADHNLHALRVSSVSKGLKVTIRQVNVHSNGTKLKGKILGYK